MDIEFFRDKFSKLIAECGRVLDSLEVIFPGKREADLGDLIDEFRSATFKFYSVVSDIYSDSNKAVLGYSLRKVLSSFGHLSERFKSVISENFETGKGEIYLNDLRKFNRYIGKVYSETVSEGFLIFISLNNFLEIKDGNVDFVENKRQFDSVLNGVEVLESDLKAGVVDPDFISNFYSKVAEFLASEGFNGDHQFDDGVETSNKIFSFLMRLRFECEEFFRINGSKVDNGQDHWVNHTPEITAIKINELYEKVKNADSSASSIISKFEQRLEESFKKLSSLEGELETNFLSFEEKFDSYDKQLKVLIEKSSKEQSKAAADITERSYKTRSDEERNSANFFRWGAIIALIATVIFAVVEIWFGTVFSANWKELLVRLTVTSILVGISAYSAKESAKHRNIQHVYERLDLDFSAFKPFIATLDKEHQIELIKLMATKTFIEREFKAELANSALNNQELAQDFINELLKKALENTKNDKP